jgi:hypothetical protein
MDQPNEKPLPRRDPQAHVRLHRPIAGARPHRAPAQGARANAMKRACFPELLDSLPFDHPDAKHSRRDLRLVNAIMRNGAWFAKVLPTLLRPGDRLLELGAGSGELGRRLGKAGIPVDGLDLCPRPAQWPGARCWHRSDLRTFTGYGSYEAVVGNLIFHQFSEEELADLGARLRRSARVILACEPARRRLSQRLMAALGPLFGASRVTLHDARVSIEGGFLGAELPLALGMDDGEWGFSCTTTALGALRMVAVRRR